MLHKITIVGTFLAALVWRGKLMFCSLSTR